MDNITSEMLQETSIGCMDAIRKVLFKYIAEPTVIDMFLLTVTTLTLVEKAARRAMGVLLEERESGLAGGK